MNAETSLHLALSDASDATPPVPFGVRDDGGASVGRRGGLQGLWEPPATRASAAAVPGLVVIWSNGAPVHRPMALTDAHTVLGSGPGVGLRLEGPGVAAEHARIERTRGAWVLHDGGSAWGTQVDASPPVRGRRERLAFESVLTVGSSLILFTADVGEHLRHGLRVEDGFVHGPRTVALHAHVARRARAGWSLLLLGESGTGKERAAAVYHAHSKRRADRFVAVNCSGLPVGVADSLLFGATRGAFTGADRDRVGYLQAADGGTLFLDELADLPLDVQPKLLRALESGTLRRLGDPNPHTVDLRVVSAAQPTLRDRIRDERFREDLSLRLGQVVIDLPALRERREEIPWIVADVASQAWTQMQETPRPLEPSFVRACVLNPWTGQNVRGLTRGVRMAVADAADRGARTVRADALRDPLRVNAGEAVGRSTTPDRTAVEEALVRYGGNASAAARALGMNRTTLLRRVGRVG